MPESWIIVDGYNLMARRGARGSQTLELARQDLVRLFEPLVGDLAERITLVFDGRAPRTERASAGAVELVFSGGQQSADSVIAALVLAAPRPSDILVATSDRLVRDAAEAAGAQTTSAGVFLDHLHTRPPRAPSARPSFHPTLGDMLPEHALAPVVNDRPPSRGAAASPRKGQGHHPSR